MTYRGHAGIVGRVCDLAACSYMKVLFNDHSRQGRISLCVRDSIPHTTIALRIGYSVKHVGPRESPLQSQSGSFSPILDHGAIIERCSQFTAKQLNRQSAKAGKDEQAEKAKLKKVSLFRIPIPPYDPSGRPAQVLTSVCPARQCSRTTPTSPRSTHRTRFGSKMRR